LNHFQYVVLIPKFRILLNSIKFKNVLNRLVNYSTKIKSWALRSLWSKIGRKCAIQNNLKYLINIKEKDTSWLKSDNKLLEKSFYLLQLIREWTVKYKVENVLLWCRWRKLCIRTWRIRALFFYHIKRKSLTSC